VAPESCKQAQAAQDSFAATQPALAASVGDAIGKVAHDANANNFLTAIERTLLWEIGTLAVVFLLTFLLPPKPRNPEELAAAGVEAV